MFVYKNDKRPMFDGDMSLKKMNIWVESHDKEKMVNRISLEFIRNAVPSMGVGPGNRQEERVRIGRRIRELREAKRMEARDLALLTGIDAANLSRIEQGKYSTGVDILSRICVILDAHLDLIPNQQ